MATAVDQHPAHVSDTDTGRRPAAPAPGRRLTALDRCKSKVSRVLHQATGNPVCGAQAFVIATIPGGEHLPEGHERLLCKHHATEQMPFLTSVGASIDDQSGTINAKPTDPSKSQGF